ncbi:flagellar biosynthetic protein FliR [Magnetospirillum sp. 64-120]|uniref:flagellar biosynthetic protein FliR n=1 Tax=Magnetospirillum sp. 64-120 TaxID=1895778 RepID=UPI00092BA67B|nr:flagellar biosynthetic protein FliR [Magnetospirillum sp. 64-120]OJX68056.1 MAG: flagellar biosynthetic protein FliR [Magnetospirillum sp. 64-120]
MLNEILTLDIYRFFLIFTRIGTAMIVLPGFGGQLVANRIRLILALAISLVMLPVVGASLPPLPTRLSGLVFLFGSEAMIGLYLGILTQTLMSTLNVAGTFIGFQIGLTNAFSFDTVAEQQSSTITAFLSNVALVAIFTTDLHHLMLRAVTDSYAVIVPGQPLPLNDFAETLSKLLSAAFNFALQLAAPLLAFGIIYNVALGLMSRMSPQIQVFFIALPLQVAGGLWMLMVALPLLILLFLRWFEQGLYPFLLPS